jgi:hypothetical protein
MEAPGLGRESLPLAGEQRRAWLADRARPAASFVALPPETPADMRAPLDAAGGDGSATSARVTTGREDMCMLAIRAGQGVLRPIEQLSHGQK